MTQDSHFAMFELQLIQNPSQVSIKYPALYIYSLLYSTVKK